MSNPALAVIKLFAHDVRDAQTLRDTAAAMCRGRYPAMKDKDVYMPFTRVELSHYKVRIHPDDAKFMYDTASALIDKHYKKNAGL